MSTEHLDLYVQSDEDFHKARTRASLQSLLSNITWRNSELLSLYEVTELIKPRNETYRGVITIPTKNIIGSEGRYHDFSQAFMPKKQMLKSRWSSVDRARIKNIILPPISCYKLGDAYFVRDGNHRVSVAISQGVEFIDAEVVELDSQIHLKSGMTMKQIKKLVVDYERKQFLSQYDAEKNLPMDEIVFSNPGFYPELVNHVNVHKYFLNEHSKTEISLDEAARSWYDNVYKPIIDVVRKQNILEAFPNSTEGDLYMWIVRHWDELKEMSGSQKVSIETAAQDYRDKYGKTKFEALMFKIRNFFSKKVIR